VSEDLWAQRDDPRVRERLILQYQPLVERVAGGMSTGLPASVDRADLVADGIFGLIEAVESFDPSVGAQFESFAMRRIRGAILDALRSIDWAPRTIRMNARQLERVRSDLQAELNRTPTEAEIGAEMGMSEESVARLMGEVNVAQVGRFDAELEQWHGYVSRSDNPGAPEFRLFDPERLADLLADAIVELTGRERVVFTLYYVEEVTFKEIGELLGVSKVRVSQLRDDAMLRVKEHLAKAS
jgi:RNA polymerase sigma factor for flagellar operon FliA